MPTKVSKILLIKNVTIYIIYLLIIWSFYRFLFPLPDQIGELVIKPIFWLGPILFVFLRKERARISSLGFTLKNLFSAIYLSIGLGSIFVVEALAANFFKYGGFSFGANIGSLPVMASLGLSFATAFSEETSFRGYIFSRLFMATGNELSANLIQSIVWMVIHIPIAFFVWNYTLGAGILYLILTFAFGIGSAFIFARTKNIAGPIFLHVLWEWPIILFR
jgi:membrane protease YdiL (CAAX protease family)